MMRNYCYNGNCAQATKKWHLFVHYHLNASQNHVVEKIERRIRTSDHTIDTSFRDFLSAYESYHHRQSRLNRLVHIEVLVHAETTTDD